MKPCDREVERKGRVEACPGRQIEPGRRLTGKGPGGQGEGVLPIPPAPWAGTYLGLLLVLVALAERGLRRSQPGNRHAEG